MIASTLRQASKQRRSDVQRYEGKQEVGDVEKMERRREDNEDDCVMMSCEESAPSSKKWLRQYGGPTIRFWGDANRKGRDERTFSSKFDAEVGSSKTYLCTYVTLSR